MFAFLAFSLLAPTATITVDPDKLGHEIPKSLYGIFLEEINNAFDGGLYAELIQNRGFEDASAPPGCRIQNGALIPARTPHFWSQRVSDWTMPWPVKSEYPGWTLEGGSGRAEIKVVEDLPLSSATPHSLQVDIRDAKPARLVNEGFWGIGAKRGDRFKLKLFVRSAQPTTYPLIALLVGGDGSVIASETRSAKLSTTWAPIEMTLVAKGTDPKAKFALKLEQPGTVYLDQVSLIPATTFKNRPNGARADLGKMIADLKPAFIRFPGGCFVEGLSVDCRPRWEETLGPLEQRRATYSPWGYWSSNGFGYHEWLQFCEDVGADGLYVFNAGISCAFRSGTYVPDSEIPALIQNALDGIEYAIGPVTSKWGALRAKNGHPKPFPLRYVEIGNEDQGARYGDRVGKFYRAIKAKYPQIKVILSSWISGIDREAIGAAGKIDIVDEHAYTGAGWALQNFDRFAGYSRKEPWELYIGEFATNGGVGRGNFNATLNDLAYMMAMEKNSDVVKMGSYAPLLENVNRRQWEVNLIHFDSSRVFGRGSYYACKLMAENRPDSSLDAKVEFNGPPPVPLSGAIGVGTYGTAAEFKDLRMTRVAEGSFDRWKPQRGEWSVVDGAYRQSSREAREIWSFFGGDFHDYELNLKARKIEGSEGFLISLGEVEGSRVQVNFGGWGNSLHAIQVNSSSPVVEKRGRIEAGRWYDVRIEVKGRTIRAYLDGELQVQTTLPAPRPLLAIAGFDRAKRQVVLKVLNSSAEPITARLKTGSASTAGWVTTLKGEPAEENSFQSPGKIVPETRHVTDVSSYTFPAHSFTIVRLPSNRRR